MTRAVPPRFRADHIGSLLRPAELRQGFREHASGAISDAEFGETQRRAIADAVAMQLEVGLEVVTDGEFRRSSYWNRFVERVRGLTIRDSAYLFRDDAGDETEFTAPHVESPLERTTPIALDEFETLQAVAGPLGLSGKITLPAPSSMHFWRGRHFCEPGIYDTPEALFEDLGGIYRDEIDALAGAGCDYIQFDEVALAMLCDPGIREHLKRQGDDPDQLVDLYISAINEAVKHAPPRVTIGLHLCRGNFKGRFLSQGGYEPVAERLFNETRANVFLLEFDTDRAGDFAPLRHVPKTKGVVLGLVCSKTPTIEPLDVLRNRIDAAGNYIDQDQLGISPQCGFASTAAGNPVTEDIQKAKLSRVVETAAAVWG